MEHCERCGKDKEPSEMVPETVICKKCQGEILEKNFGNKYHPVDVAKKLDNLERRIKILEKRGLT